MTKPVAPEVDLDDGDLDEMLFAAHAAAQSGFSHIQCDPRAIVAIITETRAHRAEQKERIGSSHNVGKPDGVRAPASSVAPAVPDTGLLRECNECHAPAKLDPDNGMCAYCCTSTAHGDESRKGQDAIMRFSTDRHHGEAARARNEAALRREAERPRGNPAERLSLSAGHPRSWPSNEGDD